MKRTIPCVASLALALSLVATLATPALAEPTTTVIGDTPVVLTTTTQSGWKQEGDGWCYYENGVKTTGPKVISGKLYCFDQQGYAIADDWYYAGGGAIYFLGSDGVAYRNRWLNTALNQWYYFGNDCALVTNNYVTYGGKVYYMGADGTLSFGFISAGGNWYYAGEDGALYHKQWLQTSSGNWCFFGDNYALITNSFIQVNGNVYYLDSNGTIFSGWLKIGDSVYYSDSNGVFVRNQWVQSSAGYYYYFGNDFALITNDFVTTDGNTYYLGSNGRVTRGVFSVGDQWYSASDTGALYRNQWYKATSGYWYYMGNDFAMVANDFVTSGENTYYMGADGRISHGWIQVGSAWYYAPDSGILLRDQWVTMGSYKYHFDSNCVCDQKESLVTTPEVTSGVHNGVDISSWQGDIDVASIDAEFVIIKASQGTRINETSNGCLTKAASALAAGKYVGFYHYAEAGHNSPEDEAVYFVTIVRQFLTEEYRSRVTLALDWESNTYSNGYVDNTVFANAPYSTAGMREEVEWVKAFLDKVYQLTGIRAYFYTSKSRVLINDWSSVAANYPLWVAQYYYNPSGSNYQTYTTAAWTDSSDFGAWGTPVLQASSGRSGYDIVGWSRATIVQYSGNGRVNGYSGAIDLNKFYGSLTNWVTY